MSSGLDNASPAVILYDAAGKAMSVQDGVAIPASTSGLLATGIDRITRRGEGDGEGGRGGAPDAPMIYEVVPEGTPHRSVGDGWTYYGVNWRWRISGEEIAVEKRINDYDIDWLRLGFVVVTGVKDEESVVEGIVRFWEHGYFLGRDDFKNELRALMLGISR